MVKSEYLCRTYEIATWTDAVDFLSQLAKKTGKLLKVCAYLTSLNDGILLISIITIRVVNLTMTVWPGLFSMISNVESFHTS